MIYSKDVRSSLPQLRDDESHQPLKKTFIHSGRDDEKCINLDIMCKLFVKCTRITVCGN